MEKIHSQQHQTNDWHEVHHQLQHVQKKSLNISNPEDQHETEADEIARKVVSGSSLVVQSATAGGAGTNRINRYTDGEELTIDIPKNAVSYHIKDITGTVVQTASGEFKHDSVIDVDKKISPGIYTICFTTSEGQEFNRRLDIKPDTKIRITIRNYDVPEFEDRYTELGIHELKDIMIRFPVMSDSLTKQMLMQTDEYLKFIQPVYHLTYSEAIIATYLMLVDAYAEKSTGVPPRDYSYYAGEAVKWSSYEGIALNDLMTKPDKRAEAIDVTSTLSSKIHNRTIWGILIAAQSELLPITTLDDLNNLLMTKSTALWDAAKGTEDDRALYWARVGLKEMLKQHPLIAGNPDLLRKAEAITDDYSRGRTDVSFTKVNESGGKLKKVLVSGFDPYQGGTTNPSGILAQMLDGNILTDGTNDIAEVEAVTFPNSYTQFDQGVVENFFTPYITDPNKRVYLIMTISLDPYAHEMQLERYAANTRAGWLDNEGIARGNDEGDTDYPRPMMPGMNFPDDQKNPQFLETNFDSRKMLDRPLPKDAKIDQSYKYYSRYGKQGGDDADLVGTGEQDKLNNPPPVTGVKALKGSGGDYFSNEIYYRVSLIRANSKNTPVKNIHLHIPKVGNDDKSRPIDDDLYEKYKIGEIYSSARGILSQLVQMQMAEETFPMHDIPEE